MRLTRTSISACGMPRHPQRRGDILVNGEVRVVDELLVDHRDIALLHRHGADVLVAEEHLAGGWPLETSHQLHQCRLAGARRPEEHVEAALGEGQVGVVDVNVGADPLDDILQFQGHGDARPQTPGSTPTRDPEETASAVSPLLLGPALDQLVIGDGLAFRLLIGELRPGPFGLPTIPKDPSPD